MQIIQPQNGGGGTGTGTSKVKVSAVDTTEGFLAAKLVAGTDISLTASGAGNETLTVAYTGAGGSDEKVKYDAGDPTAGYVADKFAAGTGISVAEGSGATENKLVITNSAPDQTVAITAGTNITSVTGTYPNFTINAATQTTDISSKVTGPATNTDSYIPQRDGANSKTLKNGIPTSTFEPALPVTPSTPESKYLNGNRVWSEILIGSGGYAANLYLNNAASSDVSGYKQISYTNDVSETDVSQTVNNSEELMYAYLFEQALSTTTIDAGAWRMSIYGAIDAAAGDSWFKFEVFTRDTGGTETVLFSQYSGLIENRVGYEGYQRITIESVQPVFTITATDRLGIKIYAKTTAAGDRTLYYKAGDGNATYANTPLALRHSQLRDLNGDSNYQHITTTQKNKLDGLTQYTDEMAQDAVGNSVGTGLDYDDTTGAISVDKTELGLVSSDVGLGNVDNTSDATKNAATATLTNKRRQFRNYSTTSTATLTPEIDTYDTFTLTAQAAALNIANHSTSTPVDKEMIKIDILSDATPRAITYGTNYIAGPNALLTTTTASKWSHMIFEWSSARSKYVCMYAVTEA